MRELQAPEPASTADVEGELRQLRTDVAVVNTAFRTAGVPRKLLESLHRKCLLTPRRQTGRVEFRTNREPRWRLSVDHPYFTPERDCLLVYLRLLFDIAAMQDAPRVDPAVTGVVSERYFGEAVRPASVRDPITDEPLSYTALVDDVVENPKHGYSRFHIGHQNPTRLPKHSPDNVRWQLKASNDFQGAMDIRVARIAYRANELTRNPDQATLASIVDGLDHLCRELGVDLRLALRTLDRS